MMNKIFKTAAAAVLLSTAFAAAPAAWRASAADLPVSMILQDKGLYEVSTYAGNGKPDIVNGPLSAASFRLPQGIAIDASGSLLIADTDNQLIRKLSGGQAATIAGTTLTFDEFGGPVGGMIDGAAGKNIWNGPTDAVFDSKGNLYVADMNNNAIRVVEPSGNVKTLAGDGVLGKNDGIGSAARFNHPQDLVVAKDGTVYVADTLNHLIRRIAPNGSVTTLNAASKRIVELFPGVVEAAGDYKDGPLSEALFNEPSGVALDSKGNLYVSDSGNQRIRYIDLAAGKVTTVAGSSLAEDGKSMYEAGELYSPGGLADGEAEQALLNYPQGIEVTSEGGLLIADSANNAVRYLYNGKLTTLVGNADGESGITDGVALSAKLDHPTDIAITADGAIYIADSFNNRIRKLDKYKLPASIVKNQEIKVVYGQSVFQLDQKPERLGGRIMVPVRMITEQLGFTVDYSAQGIVKLTKAGTTIQLQLGSTQATTTIGSAPPVVSTIDAAPYQKGDRTYVPVRFFAEQIGLDVQWNGPYQTVILRNK